MTTQAILIINAHIVNEGKITEEDLLIESGRIARIGKTISAPKGAEVIDASGKLLLPGLIDDQVNSITHIINIEFNCSVT